MVTKEASVVKKASRFIKWVISIVIVTIIGIIVYTAFSVCGFIEKYKTAIASEISSGNSTGRLCTNVTITAVFVLVVIYILLSLFNLLSHRAEEDSRMHCLPILMSPIFLIVENALLHLFACDKTNYYQVTMQVISAIVVAVITFASLKLSFEITSKRNRFKETSSVKPDIVVTKNKKGKYIVEVTHNRCYLSGIYVGKINSIVYWDVKQYGHWFFMDKLFFPNKKVSLESEGTYKIDFSAITEEKIDDICNYARLRDSDVYLIFRDSQNFYYFAQLPVTEPIYNVIGVNELVITRLAYKNNKRNAKIKNTISGMKIVNNHNIKNKVIKYESMDWFKIPYNFNP